MLSAEKGIVSMLMTTISGWSLVFLFYFRDTVSAVMVSSSMEIISGIAVLCSPLFVIATRILRRPTSPRY